MSDADVVVCEGFKKALLPKIEVFRASVHATALFADRPDQAFSYLAIVTDTEEEMLVDFPVIRFSDGEWLTRLASLVEREVMRR